MPNLQTNTAGVTWANGNTPGTSNNVTAYGLFVEHYQKTEVFWNGNGGRTYFLQNEQPYDPPSNAVWRSDGSATRRTRWPTT